MVRGTWKPWEPHGPPAATMQEALVSAQTARGQKGTAWYALAAPRRSRLLTVLTEGLAYTEPSTLPPDPFFASGSFRLAVAVR